MHKLLFFNFWFIALGSICQIQPDGFLDTPTITENSVGKAQLGMPVAKLKALYQGYSFAPTHMMQYGFDDTNTKPSGVTVSRNGQRLFLYLVDWQTKKRVAGLLVLHASYKTAKGICVGSTSGQLKAALPSVQVVPNMMLPAFQVAFTGVLEKPGIEYVFFKQKELGEYDVADEPAKIVVINAKVSWIQIRANQ